MKDEREKICNAIDFILSNADKILDIEIDSQTAIDLLLQLSKYSKN